jgi:hypothetical protein
MSTFIATSFVDARNWSLADRDWSRVSRSVRGPVRERQRPHSVEQPVGQCVLRPPQARPPARAMRTEDAHGGLKRRTL